MGPFRAASAAREAPLSGGLTCPWHTTALPITAASPVALPLAAVPSIQDRSADRPPARREAQHALLRAHGQGRGHRCAPPPLLGAGLWECSCGGAAGVLARCGRWRRQGSTAVLLRSCISPPSCRSCCLAALVHWLLQQRRQGTALHPPAPPVDSPTIHRASARSHAMTCSSFLAAAAEDLEGPVGQQAAAQKPPAGKGGAKNRRRG